MSNRYSHPESILRDSLGGYSKYPTKIATLKGPNVAAALGFLFGQAMSFSEKISNPANDGHYVTFRKEGFFYVTYRNAFEGTGMEEKSFKRAVEVLVEVGLIETDLRGVPPKKHYRLHPSFDANLTKILKESEEAKKKRDGHKAESDSDSETKNPNSAQSAELENTPQFLPNGGIDSAQSAELIPPKVPNTNIDNSSLDSNSLDSTSLSLSQKIENEKNEIEETETVKFRNDNKTYAPKKEKSSFGNRAPAGNQPRQMIDPEPMTYEELVGASLKTIRAYPGFPKGVALKDEKYTICDYLRSTNYNVKNNQYAVSDFCGWFRSNVYKVFPGNGKAPQIEDKTAKAAVQWDDNVTEVVNGYWKTFIDPQIAKIATRLDEGFTKDELLGSIKDAEKWAHENPVGAGLAKKSLILFRQKAQPSESTPTTTLEANYSEEVLRVGASMVNHSTKKMQKGHYEKIKEILEMGKYPAQDMIYLAKISDTVPPFIAGTDLDELERMRQARVIEERLKEQSRNPGPLILIDHSKAIAEAREAERLNKEFEAKWKEKKEAEKAAKRREKLLIEHPEYVEMFDAHQKKLAENGN